MKKALIIEDEPLARDELRSLLQDLDAHIQVVAELDSIESSIHWLQQHPAPDMIFLDIQLSDGVSFEIFKQVHVKAPIIFTTAYDQYAIQAFKVNSVDYLLKPIESDDLATSLKKLESFHPANAEMDYERLLDVVARREMVYRKRFMVRRGEKIWHINTSDIAYFQSMHESTFLLTYAGRKHLIQFTLEQLEELLDPAAFFRINRQYISHINAVKQAEKYFNNRLTVKLEPSPDEEVIISRAKVPSFLNWLES